MRKVAVFGNAGGGKSTLARRLAVLTGLPLYPLDTIKYREGGGEVPHDEYLKIHTNLLGRDEWIIDGFGCVASAWERLSAADTLIYIDLPLFTHYGWVTKRLVKGLFVNPEERIRDFPEILQSHTVLGIHFASSARLRSGRVTPPTSSKKCTITLRTSSNVVLRQLKNEHGSAI
jgi:hypothetical protein